ncbi:hypothetical protein ACQRIU_004805 [Beauveria bassiana]
MSSRQPRLDVSPDREEDEPWAPSSSSMNPDIHAGEPQRMSSTSFGAQRLQPLRENEIHRWRYEDTELPVMGTTLEPGADHDDRPDLGSHSRRNSNHDNPLGLSHQSSQFKLRRVPVSSKEDTSASRRSVPSPRTPATASGMPSPDDTLVDVNSPRRASRWSSPWGFSAKGLSRNKGSSEPLTMNMQPISGTDCPSITEEGGYDGSASDADCPKQCCVDGPELCSSRRDIQSPASSSVIWVRLLSIISTGLSTLWLVVAISQPRWGRKISSNAAMKPSIATMTAALGSKIIEMSFVTVYITCLGQSLTRRAIARGSRGITLAEMSMREWVNEPGNLLMNSRSNIKHSGCSLLGVLSLLAGLVAAFYTTASDAMVAPKLKYGKWENRTLSGYIRSSYANPIFVKLSCSTMLKDEDKEEAASSCMDVMVSGESYRNLQAFMRVWTNININGSTLIRDLKERPAGTASLHGNTTLLGAWIETEHGNVTAHSEETGRIINNVTLAMPHPGVAAAATSPLNGILQPNDLSGVGEYSIKAGVVSPAVNVLCVNMSPSELAPLVYTEWPHANNSATGMGNQTIGWKNWTSEVPDGLDSNGNENFLNRTEVDDIFRWGPKYNRRPPVFKLFPFDYNTVVNSREPLGIQPADAIYILGKRPKFQNYTLCELRSWLSPNCSTHFTISGISGSKMVAHCEDPNDIDSYRRSFPKDQGWALPATDWKHLAEQWRTASDLNGGERNSDPANSRILTQLALVEPKLPVHLPSMAEALAVFASSTLVLGSVGTPFRHYWDYNKPGNIVGEPGAIHQFNASVITQEYTSGHVANWQGMFYVILGLMCGLNLICAGYLVRNRKLVTDFTEGHNLFSLALNSAPNERLKGTCGGGPEGSDMAVPWRVGYASGANHYYIEETTRRPRRRGRGGQNSEAEAAKVVGQNYTTLRNSRGWL